MFNVKSVTTSTPQLDTHGSNRGQGEAILGVFFKAEHRNVFQARKSNDHIVVAEPGKIHGKIEHIPYDFRSRLFTIYRTFVLYVLAVVRKIIGLVE